MFKKLLFLAILLPVAAYSFTLNPCVSGSALQFSNSLGFVCGVPTISMANITILDANYNALSTDQVITYNTLTASRTVTLTPAGSPSNLKLWQIKDYSGNASVSKSIVLASTSGTFDGLVSTAISEAYGSKTFFDDGTNFFMGAAFLPSVNASSLIQKADGNGGMLNAVPGVDYALPGASRSQSSVTHTIVTGTGATGFQVSVSRDSEVRYNTTIVTSATLASSASGTIVLEVAPTNSAVPSDWVEIGRITNGQVFSLAVAIGCTQTTAGQLSAYVPAGYYGKLRSINNSGTPTYSYNSGVETLL